MQCAAGKHEDKEKHLAELALADGEARGDRQHGKGETHRFPW
jgi:hypothetical protein